MARLIWKNLVIKSIIKSLFEISYKLILVVIYGIPLVRLSPSQAKTHPPQWAIFFWKLIAFRKGASKKWSLSGTGSRFDIYVLKLPHGFVAQSSISRTSVESILEKTRQLESFPESGRFILEMQKQRRYRELIIKPYGTIQNWRICRLCPQIIHYKRFFEGTLQF